jgi:D-arabinose 1-dehydrogenase-like Zn-dependent alcohol dehydrogenase
MCRAQSLLSNLILHSIQPEVDFRRIDDLPRMIADMEAGKAENRQVVVF